LPALHFADSEFDDVDLPMLDDRLVILQAGVLNPNKHIEIVIEAFEKAEISDRAQLVICGHASRRTLSALHAAVVRRGLVGSVHVLGPVSDASLHTLRKRASIATVLRDPCIEASSAVLLDSMAYGLAPITVSTGHYVEIPDDAAVQVPAPPVAAELAPALRALVDDGHRVSTIGAAAHAHIAGVHSALHYAEAMLQVFHSAGAYPRREALAHDLSTILSRVGFSRSDRVAEVIADSATELFGANPRRGLEFIRTAT
jgi:glycosyltransferase involved in cell wall biosynthesis